MATDLTVSPLPATIACLPPSLAALVCSMSPEGYPRTIPRALHGAERKEAELKAAELSCALQAGSRREVGAIVARLLAIYPVTVASDTALAAQMDTWVEALEGCPAWAVDAARKRWVQGKVPGVNAEFAPKPPTFRRLVDEEVFAARERRDQLTMLLKAKAPDPPVTDAERARVEELKREYDRDTAALRAMGVLDAA